jgi:hypothetical protein
MAIGTPSGSSLVQGTATFIEASIAVSTADSLFVACKADNAVSGAPVAHTVTDQTNSETVVEQYSWTQTNECRLSLWKLEVATGATKTIRFASSETERKSIQVHKNTATGGFTKDKDSSASGTATNVSSGNTATTTQANEYLIGACTSAFNQTFTPTGGTGWTVLSDSGTSRPTLRCDYKIVSATGAYSYAGAWSASAVYLIGIATFYETGGAAVASLLVPRNPMAPLLVR